MFEVLTYFWQNQKLISFYAPGLKGPPGHLVIGSPVCQFVCLFVIPSRLQSAIFKGWVMIQLPNLDSKFIDRFLTLLWHHMPLGSGRVKM